MADKLSPDEKAERRAAALRANLKRRKAAGRKAKDASPPKPERK